MSINNNFKTPIPLQRHINFLKTNYHNNKIIQFDNLIEKRPVVFNKLGYIEKSKNSLHSLSPYVGKIRSDLTKYLIDKYAQKGKYICDPFCGSGTVLLEGWEKGYDVIGIDLNLYAYTLSMGKINPLFSPDLAKEKLEIYNYAVLELKNKISIANMPCWVKSFYHKQTLKEICAWVMILQQNKEYFLTACLMGILHHQRPGFLSYPSSHGAPYLRINKYPKEKYPEMYEYKNVYEKLLKKIQRVFKNVPNFNYTLSREVYFGDSSQDNIINKRVATIITSPPYMKSLTYARDNRLRLWFLGVEDWQELDKIISPSSEYFVNMMKNSFALWKNYQIKNDKCIIIIGDIPINILSSKILLQEIICDIAKPNYHLVEAYEDPIPEEKKMVKGNETIKREIILVLERK